MSIPALITLTTDFGTRDPYVAQMKGVIRRHCPGVVLEDLSHDIPAQELMAVALFLEAAVPRFPSETIHLVVVDPGVGAARLPVAIRAGGQWIIGPDNGITTLLLKQTPLEKAYAISTCPLLPPAISHTFHGRDIFSPAAAWLALGEPAEALGPEVAVLQRLPFPDYTTGADGSISGEVVHIDHFGNCITNIPALSGVFNANAGYKVLVAGVPKALPVLRTYAEVPEGAPVALFGSSGRLEIAVRNGSARAMLGINKGCTVSVDSGEASMAFPP